MEPIEFLLNRIITPENSVAIINLALLIYIVLKKILRNDNLILDKLTKNFTELTKTMLDLQNTHFEISKQLDSINNTIISQSSDSSHVSNRIVESISDYKTRLDTLDTTLNNISHKLQDLSLMLDNMSEHDSNLKTDISNLTNQIRTDLNTVVRDMELVKFILFDRGRNVQG